MSDMPWIDAQTCERRVFRDMLGSFMTGVTVVAARNGHGEACAFTANSFTSVSLDPPMVLVCLARSATSFADVTQAETFSINILGEWQQDLSRAFAARSEAKLQALEALTAATPPLVEESLANIVCTRNSIVDAGDHVILLGTVTHFRIGEGQPLGYFRGGYVGFGVATRSEWRQARSADAQDAS